MKQLLILFLFISTICTAQIKDFFKYSTFYTSMTMNTSMTERENYIAIDKGYEDTTVDKKPKPEVPKKETSDLKNHAKKIQIYFLKLLMDENRVI